ncbi:MAG: helix-turn-helix transcriptional regulator [Clostridia bacterium]|nr:helix-turn-helix transcriptional regulator [Clostridia bacterium]
MIYDRIKELREKSGYSQAALAKRLSVTRSSVNAWEMGISVPTTQYVVEMARLFRVSTDYLLGVDSKEVLTLEGLSKKEIKLLYDLIDYFRSDK